MNKNESKYFNTGKRMNDALIFLLERKDFEYISIKEICAIAKVNRSTFYLHYSNMNDLLEETIDNLTSSFAAHFNSNENINTIIRNSDVDKLYLIKDEYLIPYLEFIKENRKIYKAIKNNPSLFKVNSMYDRFFKSLFVPIMNRFGLDEIWHKYLMDFYLNGISAILIDWIIDDCKIPTIDVSNFIKGLVIKHDKGTNNSTER